MRVIFSLACLAAAISTTEAWEMDKMAFAFNMNRHGARAPQAHASVELFGDDMKQFKAVPGNLTA